MNLFKKFALNILLIILYVITARFSQLLFTPGTTITPVWPPAGIAQAAVLLFGNSVLIGILIGCTLSNFHMFLGDSLTIMTVVYAIIPGIGGALQAYLGKKALNYFAQTNDIFNDTRSVLIFIFISAFLICMINPTLSITTLIIAGKLSISEIHFSWLTWWIADAVGVVAITSTIMAWHQQWSHSISISELVKLGVTWLCILVVGRFILHNELKMAFLLVPFAILAPFQFEIRFSTLTGLLISAICLYVFAADIPIIHHQSITSSILLIQIFISIIFLTILITHVILSTRQKAYNNLQSLNLQLEQRVLDRTKDLSASNEQLNIQKNKALEALEALKQSHSRLMQSEKMASLGMLTAGVAHEIKHPLNAMSSNMKSIKMNAEQILQSVKQIGIDKDFAKAEEKIHEDIQQTDLLIDATNEGIKRTAGIIADLCAFARADEPEMVTCDLHRNIDATLNLLSSEIRGNDISIIKEYGEIPNFLCHPGKINQVLMNILINAIHALQTQHGSQITIRTETKNNFIVLSIEDNAKGMKKEVLDNLFTPFFTTKQSGKGSGLGLFISQNIIKEHRGTISVESEVNKGTKFIIHLPI